MLGSGFELPIYFLDTDLPENNEWLSLSGFDTEMQDLVCVQQVGTVAALYPH